MSTKSNDTDAPNDGEIGEQSLVLSPTPWTASKWQSDSHVYNSEIKDANGENVVSIVRETDGQVMAASPELLKACMLLTDWASYPGDAPQMLTEAIDAAYYAIAKATEDASI